MTIFYFNSGLEDESYTVVFLSPEILGSIDMWRFFLESSAYTDAVALLAVDEAHLLHSW
jgi:superfamily II DNA helicase RecQ